MFDLYSIGEMMWLTTLNPAKFPRSGITTELISSSNMIGNDATITALLASRIGLKVKFCTNASLDIDGTRLINILKKNKVSLDLSISKERQTPINFCILEKNGKRTWLPPSGNFFPTLPNKQFNAHYIYLDFYEESASVRLNALSKLVSQNQKIFINLSDSSIDKKIDLIKRRHKGKLHIIQISASTNFTQAKKIAVSVMETLSPKGVIVTLGKKGSVLHTGNNISIIRLSSKQHKKIYRSMGAGSAFSAGFISGLVKGVSLEDSHLIASSYSIDFCARKDDPLI